jgi:hypothetical protein
MSRNEIRAVDMVRRIRDELAEKLAGKTPQEVIAYYREAGRRALEEARRQESGTETKEKAG